MSSNKIRSQGMLFSVQSGRCVTTPPFGYWVKRGARTKYSRGGLLLVDEKNAAIVKDIYDKYATGEYALISLHAYITKTYGPILHKSHINRILQNKFYMGIMSYKGKEYPHIYPHLITLDLYEKAQYVMKNNSKYKLAGKMPEKKKLATSTKFESPVSKLIKFCESPQTINNIAEYMHITNQEVRLMLVDMELEEKMEELAPDIWISKNH